MSDGKKWDEGPGAKARTATLAGPLAAWLRAHPELEGTVEELGDPVLAPGVIEDARKTDAPDPIAFVSVGERVFRTPLLARSFQPAWGFSFVVEVMPGTSDLLRLDVVDWDGPDQVDAIGTLVLPAAGLVGGQKLRTLPRFGNVASLTMLVEPAAGARLEKRLAVPGKPTWTDTGLDVLAGQTIVIEASGQVCSYNAERCDYPDGQQSPSEANERGFPKLGHAALIGAIADTRFKVGRERRFVAPASGRLFLGVNDRASSDNTGSFDTRIRLGDTLPP